MDLGDVPDVILSKLHMLDTRLSSQQKKKKVSFSENEELNFFADREQEVLHHKAADSSLKMESFSLPVIEDLKNDEGKTTLMDLIKRDKSRKETQKLKLTMESLSQKLYKKYKPRVNFKATDADFTEFMDIIEEENKINSTVFQELINQISGHMVERGEVLTMIRDRYQSLFHRIPKMIKDIFERSVRNESICARFELEIKNYKDFLFKLIKGIDGIQQFDRTTMTGIGDYHETLIYLKEFLEQENLREKEEYHIYKFQRDKLEESLKVSERDKKIWLETSHKLASRVAQLKDVPLFEKITKFEISRYKTTMEVFL